MRSQQHPTHGIKAWEVRAGGNLKKRKERDGVNQRAQKGRDLFPLPEGWPLYKEYMFTVGENRK